MRLMLMLLGLLIVGCEITPTIKEPSSPPPVVESTVIKTGHCDVQVVIEFKDYDEILVIEIPPEIICEDKDIKYWI